MARSHHEDEGMMATLEAEHFDLQGFIEGRVHPSMVLGTKSRALELRFMWGAHLLDVAQIERKRKVTIGESRSCDFFLGSEDLPLTEFPIISHEGEYFLNFTPKMEGVFRAGERTVTLKEAIEGGLAAPDLCVEGAHSIMLGPDARAAIQLGGVTVLVRSVVPSRPIAVPFAQRVDYSFLNTLLASLFLHLALLVTAVNHPYDTRLMKDEVFTMPNRFTRLIVTPPEPPRHEALLARLKNPDEAADSERHKGDEGKAGLEELLDKEGRSAVRAVDPTDRQIVSETIRRLSGGERSLSKIFDQAGLGGEIEGALGTFIGSFAQDGGGEQGLGLRGIGGGADGLSAKSIGIGPIGTRARGGGLHDYGTDVAGLRGHSESDIDVSGDDPVIEGPLDRELIRRVIHANRSQIRYCYERELQRHPGLHGRIAVRFTIEANGTVSAAAVDQNTLGNQEVASCLLRRLRSWIFPEPKGNSVVIVTYPFVFQRAG